MFDQSKKPFFSIIIPTYNRASTIARAISSVINQSFGNWELIVIDDGSNDDTKEIVEKFNDVRIRYFWQENQERSAARNYGISLAKGEWICFLDSDDEYLPNHLNVFSIAIVNHPKVNIFRTGLICDNIKGRKIKTKIEKSTFVLDTYPYDFIVLFAFNKSVFKKQLFDIRFSYMEDMHLLLRLGEENLFFQIIDWTYIYNVNPYENGRLSKNFEKIILNKNLCIDDMMTFRYNPIRKSLIWTKITNGFFFFKGSIRYNPAILFRSILIIINNFILYPFTTIKVIIRIMIVKFCEFLGFTFDNYRF